jgi:uncharacterized protein (DUF1499 family)
MTQATESAAQGGKGARIALALAWIGVGLALACGIAELLAGPGYRWGWWRLGSGIQIIVWSATADFAAVLLTLVAALLAWKYGARRALAAGAMGLALALIVVGPPLYYWRLAGQTPLMHDISTDTGNPPRFVAVMPLRKGAKNSTDYGAEDAAQQKAYPDIAPAMLDVPPAQALQRAERAARALGWDIVAVAGEDLRIEATDTTLLFGFKDDIVIRVTPNASGSRVDMRSLSRLGGGDLGVNANRIRSFMKQLDAAKAGG